MDRRNLMQVLLTQCDAMFALETLFLDAERQIRCSFPKFDPATRLLSARALAIGQSWADLIRHTLSRGVAVTLTVSDFDPVLYPAAHQASHVAVGMLRQVAEQYPDARLTIRVIQHEGQTGVHNAFRRWPTCQSQVARVARWMSQHLGQIRASAMTNSPGPRDGLLSGKNGKLRVRLVGLPPPRPYCHNQKMAVFDLSKVFIGSFDLDPATLDQPDLHGLSLVLTGPVVAECGVHLDSFLDSVAGQGAPPPAPARLLLRTLSRRGDSKTARSGNILVLQDIFKMHETLVRLSSRLIYMETGRLQEPDLTARLIHAAQTNARLTMILVLHQPVPGGTRWSRLAEWKQGRTIRQLARAFGDRLFVGGYVAAAVDGPACDALSDATPYDAQSNVSIFDGRAGIVSSAKLDRAGLRYNTEAGVYINSPLDLAELRRAVMARWLPTDAPEPFFALETAVDRWASLARENFKKPASMRRGLILPFGN